MPDASLTIDGTEVIRKTSGVTTLKNTTISSDVTFPNFVGMIAAFAMASPPTGWLACQGQTLDANTDAAYDALFNAIGTTWGGTGKSSFLLPDLRGEFLRGFDNGAGNDSDATSRTGGDTVGSSQAHALPALFGSWSNQHGSNGINVYNDTGLSGTTAIVGVGASVWRQSIETSSGSFQRVDLDSTRVIPNGSDVRPRNKCVQYCIRWK